MKKNGKGARFRVGQMKNAQMEPRRYSPQWVANQAKQVMDELALLIRVQHIPPQEAMVLIAMKMDLLITGQQRWLGEDEIVKICKMILAYWQSGLFKPCSTYPYTLEETLAAGRSEEA